jgi:recombination protein RecT
MTSSVSAAIATVEKKKSEIDLSTPTGVVEYYTDEFAALLPTHIKSQMFIRAAVAGLRTGPKTGKLFDLEIAARNNPQAFVNTLRTAARLGLAPGTEEFYFTSRRNKGVSEILGIVGYQGYIELMFRAGYISSVVVDTVHAGETFEFVRGVDDKPRHVIDWRAKRGAMELVYAYAKMKDGSTSYVVVLNKFDIDEIKENSASWKSGSKTSPWRTNERAMWLKSAVRRLKTWVPTSTERIDLSHASAPVVLPDLPTIGHEPVPVTQQVQLETGDDDAPADDDAIVDAEVVPVADDVPPLEEPPADVEDPAPPPPDDGPAMSRPQQRKMMALFAEKGFTGPEDRHAFVTGELKIPITSSGNLSAAQATVVIDALTKLDDPPPPAAQGSAAAGVAADVAADGAAQ